ncbi:hypothetical protein EEGS01_10220 [Escherichia coli]|nr:hypothetical protein EEGS01_10220 [Escherichia coli]
MSDVFRNCPSLIASINVQSGSDLLIVLSRSVFIETVSFMLRKAYTPKVAQVYLVEAMTRSHWGI